MNIKKMTTCIIFMLFSNNISAQEYKLKLDDANYKDHIFFELTYDKEGWNNEGWNKEGLNKVTGTEYDENGFNESGYDLKGFNEERIHKITKTIYDEEGYDFQEFNASNVGKDVCFSGDSSHYYSYGYYRVSSIGPHGTHLISFRDESGNYSGRKNTVGSGYASMSGHTGAFVLYASDIDRLYSFRKYGGTWYSRPDNGSSYEYKTGVCKKRVNR
jgi:hypothetical protein